MLYFEVRCVHKEFDVLRGGDRFEDVLKGARDDPSLGRELILVGPLHGERLARTRLPVGEHRSVVPFEAVLRNVKMHISLQCPRWTDFENFSQLQATCRGGFFRMAQILFSFKAPSSVLR